MSRCARLAGLSVVLAVAAPARGQTTACTAITAVPYTITDSAVYCLRNNLNTSIASGAAITITTT